MEQAKTRLGCAIPGTMFVAAVAIAAALLAHGDRDRAAAHASLGAPHAAFAAPPVVDRR